MNQRTTLLFGAITIIVGVIVYIEYDKNHAVPLDRGEVVQNVYSADPKVIEKKQKEFEPAHELVGIEGFLNTQPFALKDSIGKKVILVDFWTYSCINCQRTQPYLNAWYEKYKDSGLEIIGVHTPEFDFEKEYKNVEEAIKQFHIQYPVVLDNTYATWRAYNNQYWPRKYLIDIDGFIVYDHIGEGGYEDTERQIQRLLKERSERLGTNKTITVDTVDPKEKEVVSGGAQTPEIYFGASRNERFGNGEFKKIIDTTFVVPKTMKRDFFYLEGPWSVREEYAENKKSGTRIVLPYHGNKVFMVAGANQPVTIRVLRDGKPVGEFGGSSVKDGVVTVQSETLYRLVSDPVPGEHILELIIEGVGLKAFTFTFG